MRAEQNSARFESLLTCGYFSVTSLVGQSRLGIDSLHLFSEPSGEGEGLRIHKRLH